MITSLSRLSRVVFCAAALAGASISFGQLTLTNSPAWNGADYIFPFGEPEVATFGQVFTVDTANTILEGFTFQLRSASGGDVDFRGYVGAWDGVKLTGPLLFESGLQSLPAGTNFFQSFSFDTEGLVLTQGAQYLAFISASSLFDTIEGIADVGITAASDTFTGGNMVIASNGADFAMLSTDPWFELFGMDMAFSMELSGGGAVPEPPITGAIAALALLAIVGMRRIRGAAQTWRERRAESRQSSNGGIISGSAVSRFASRIVLRKSESWCFARLIS